MRNHDIAIIGIFPPPIGGVSIHVERLTKNLNSKSINYIVYNLSKRKTITKYNIFDVYNLKLWLIKYLFNCRDKIIHCHERNWYLVFILCLIKKIHKSKLILTLHSFRENPKEFNKLKRVCFFYSLKNVDYFLAVGENEKSKLIDYCCNPNKIIILPAYINPDDKGEDYKMIPDYVWSFMNNNDLNVVANASRIAFYNNEDLYGIDMLVDLCYELKKTYKDKRIGFVFSLPGINDYDYYNKLKLKIAEYNISSEFLFVTEKLPLYPILKKSNIFIRPTNTDGDAISIREALYYKIPAIVSDVVTRPEGSILFSTRNINDLYNKTIDLIIHYDFYKEKLKNIKIDDNIDGLFDIYRHCLNDII